MFRNQLIQESQVTGITLEQGRPSGATGAVTADSRYVTTGLIHGGALFALVVNPEYRIVEQWLYNADGTLAQADNDGSFYKISTVPGYNSGRNFSLGLHKSLACRLVVVRNSLDTNDVAPKGNISPADNIIADFCRMEPHYFTKEQSAISFHNLARQKLMQYFSLMFRMRRSQAGVDSVRTGKGALWLSPIYANVGWQGKRVGQNVTYYTFLTAMANKRSLAYTEMPTSGISGYGIEYPNENIHAHNARWFGSVCHDVPNIAMNSPKCYIEASFGSNNLFGTEQVTVSSAEDCRNLKPYDFFVKNTHVYLLLDVIKDSNGATRWLLIAENGSFTDAAKLVLRTPEHCFQYMTSIGMSVYRPKASNTLTFDNNLPVENTPFLPSSLDADITPISYNEDICTFEGDKASFRVGGKVFVNVRRDNGRWTGMRLYKRGEDENYHLVDTLPIGPSVYPNSSDDDPDTSGREDWVDVDLSDRFSSKEDAGLYRATAYNNQTGAESLPTDFELLYLDITKVEYFNDLSSSYVEIATSGNINSLRIMREAFDGTANASKDVYFVPQTQQNRGNLCFKGSAYNTYITAFARGSFGNDVLCRVQAISKSNLLPGTGGYTQRSIITNSGAIGSNSYFSVSGLIAVQPDSVYRLAFTKGSNNNKPMFVNFYASNEDGAEPIATVLAADAQSLDNGTYAAFCFETGEDIHYIRITVCSSDQNKSLVYVGPRPQRTGTIEAIDHEHVVDF